MCEIWYLSWPLLSSSLVHKGSLKSCSKPLQLTLNRPGGARHLWLRVQLSWIWSVLHNIKRGEVFPFDYPKGFPLPHSGVTSTTDANEFHLPGTQVSSLLTPKLCTVSSIQAWKHTKGRGNKRTRFQRTPLLTSQSDLWWMIFLPQMTIHVFTNVIKWLKCLRICLFTSLPGHSGWPGEEIRKAMCTRVTRSQSFDRWEIKQPAWKGRWRGDPESCTEDIKLLFPEGSIYRPINQSGAVAGATPA